ncbi:MAG: hypothetical protein OEM98_05655 [Gammaproteobacteria bacterium]|nr:hypothetical protein [Gammaproteobacteria bacterium]
MWYASKRFRLERRAARAYGLKDYASAIQALEDLLNVVGENPNTLHVLALCRQRRGDHEAAIATAARGVAADPEHLCCVKLLAELHAGRGELEIARIYAARALALMDPPGSGRAPLPRLIRVLAKIGSGDSARPHSDDSEWARWARGLCDTSTDAGTR